MLLLGRMAHQINRAAVTSILRDIVHSFVELFHHATGKSVDGAHASVERLHAAISAVFGPPTYRAPRREEVPGEAPQSTPPR